jgi:hypothetical protein
MLLPWLPRAEEEEELRLLPCLQPLLGTQEQQQEQQQVTLLAWRCPWLLFVAPLPLGHRLLPA